MTARPAISNTCAASIVNGTVRVARTVRAFAPEGLAAISPKTPPAMNPSRLPEPASILAVKQDERAPFVDALQRARVAAYAPGEFVEQESFMRAGEIRALAHHAGIAPGVSVLDLCCGIGGPGALHHGGAGLRLPRGRLQRRRHRHRASSVPATSHVASRWRGSPRFPRVRSTWWSCSRRCWHSPRRSRCFGRSPARSLPAGGSPAPSKEACPSPRRSESRCPTPTPCGSSRSTRCSPPWTESGWSSAGRKTTLSPTPPRPNR